MPTKEKTRDNCSTNNISCLSLVYILSLVLIYEKELCEIIIKHNITEYMEFNLYVQYYLEADYFDVASNNTYYFNSLINSFRHNPEKIMARYKVIKEEISGSVDSNKEDKEHDS